VNPTTTNASDAGGRPFSPEQVRSLAAALERHAQERLFGERFGTGRISTAATAASSPSLR
jgi:hypothetical protein